MNVTGLRMTAINETCGPQTTSAYPSDKYPSITVDVITPVTNNKHITNSSLPAIHSQRQPERGNLHWGTAVRTRGRNYFQQCSESRSSGFSWSASEIKEHKKDIINNKAHFLKQHKSSPRLPYENGNTSIINNSEYSERDTVSVYPKESRDSSMSTATTDNTHYSKQDDKAVSIMVNCTDSVPKSICVSDKYSTGLNSASNKYHTPGYISNGGTLRDVKILDSWPSNNQNRKGMKIINGNTGTISRSPAVYPQICPQTYHSKSNIGSGTHSKPRASSSTSTPSSDRKTLPLLACSLEMMITRYNERVAADKQKRLSLSSTSSQLVRDLHAPSDTVAFKRHHDLIKTICDVLSQNFVQYAFVFQGGILECVRAMATIYSRLCGTIRPLQDNNDIIDKEHEIEVRKLKDIISQHNKEMDKLSEAATVIDIKNELKKENATLRLAMDETEKNDILLRESMSELQERYNVLHQKYIMMDLKNEEYRAENEALSANNVELKASYARVFVENEALKAELISTRRLSGEEEPHLEGSTKRSSIPHELCV